ncbi:protein TIS11-like [Anopheles moucheti]|uniref:protein TIS11-like n=1 Tax=Anopheles moucheti TaxID=186751 RepID=UPI0022F0FEA9|nr:protein TIS11-like [Anopheles moucheti]
MSTAIMHSASLYDFGEYPRKNQTNTSRGNTQMIVGGGGVGAGNVHNITPVGGASSNSNGFVFASTFNVTAALAATNSNGNGQQTLNGNHHIEQQQSQQSPHFHRKIPLGRLLLDLDDTSAQHKQQQQANNGGAGGGGGGGGGGGASHHHTLYRTASQPATRQIVGNLLEMIAMNGIKLTQDISFGSTGSNSVNSISSNNGNNSNQHATTSNTTSSSSGHRKLERTQSEPLPQQVNTSRYKTELCRPYEEAGECKYGDKCQFAHGMQELRNLQRHPKYKTELCRTFHSVGFCPYGPRCHFVHNAEEARNHNRNVAAYHARLAAAAAASAGNNASSQSSQTGTRTGNGPSMLNSNNQQQHHHGHGHHHSQQQQQHKAMSMAQLQTAILQHSSIAHVQQQQQQQQLQQHHQQQQHHHQLPLSPALSMSTGSDRASPIGSLSLSPTTSMANFFPEAISPTLQQGGAIPQPFLFPTSPPASPIEGLSPMGTPPPSSPSLVAMKMGGGGHAGVNNMTAIGMQQEERLPVFNMLSSVVETHYS